MTIHYRPLTASVKMAKMSRQTFAMRKATRAQSQQAADNAEAALRRDRGEDEPED